MACEVVYASCACNRTPYSADWGYNNLLSYGACHAVAICRPKSPCKVIDTLTGHKDRVNSVQWINTPNKGPETELVSASADKTARVWRRIGDTFQLVDCLEGHTGGVTLARGFYLANEDREEAQLERSLIATTSVDSTVKIWERTSSAGCFNCMQTISFGTGFALALSWIELPGTAVPLLACGGDDHRVHLLIEQEAKFLPVQTLPGHEDWIRGLDMMITDEGNVFLASCSQDQYIRIWRLLSHPAQPATSSLFDDLKLNEDIHMKETTFTVNNKWNGESMCFSITLESVLEGHEGWIYSVHWHPEVTEDDDTSHQPLVLLSASIDKTLILWRPDQKTGVWIEQMRVGAVGGNTLGFYGGLFSPDGHSIMSHGYQGSFQIWHQQQDSDNWLAGVTVGGHFASVEDIGWDPEGGQFVISVSLDQTTRLHGYWKSDDKSQRSWHELARPQIHGYDIQCIAMMSRWRFASGADEKVIRIFEAPRNFMQNLSQLTGVELRDAARKKDDCAAPEGASVPALGLSNKAIFKDSSTPPSDDREIQTGSSSQYPELYFSPLALNAPPTEDNLLQNTLWPEVQKLYGHGYEIFALAYHPQINILASACKAAKAEHAAVILWDASSWHVIDRLSGHSLTVTQLVFSHSGEYLLSTSRDRTWSLYKLTSSELSTGTPYTRVAYTDKKTSVHTRIIWSGAFSPDDQYFITVSRDKKAVMWAVDDSPSSGHGDLGHCRASSTPLDLPDSITAVDFAPGVLSDNSYLVAFGLDSGSIHICKYVGNTTSSADGQKWLQLLVLDQRMAHHLTVKRLCFRPTVGEVGGDADSSGLTLQLASCGADHMVKIYTVRNIS